MKKLTITRTKSMLCLDMEVRCKRMSTAYRHFYKAVEQAQKDGAFDFYAFDSKKKRDAWVDEHEWDGYPNRTAGTSTRRAVEHCCGKDFSLVEADEGMWVCCRKGLEYVAEMELENIY